MLSAQIRTLIHHNNEQKALCEAWTEPPEYVFEALVEHFLVDKDRAGHFSESAIYDGSASCRLVCKAWRNAHDRHITILKPKGAQPDARVWEKFAGVKTLFANGFLVNEDYVKALAPLTALSSLDLAGRIIGGLGDHNVGELTPLTSLTHLNLGQCYGLSDEGMSKLARLTHLTSLDLTGCDHITDEGVSETSQPTQCIKLLGEGDTKKWSTVLFTALGSWGKPVPPSHAKIFCKLKPLVLT
jgi:hypothetical protein